jgi:hypothetical protein
MHLTASSVAPSLATVAVDVSAYKLNLMCRELSAPGASAEWEIDNRTEAITSTLLGVWERAQARGITTLRVIVEPTGVYHKLLLRIAAGLGFQTFMVDAGHVKKMRSAPLKWRSAFRSSRRRPRKFGCSSLYLTPTVFQAGRSLKSRADQPNSSRRPTQRLHRTRTAALLSGESPVHRAVRAGEPRAVGRPKK